MNGHVDRAGRALVNIELRSLTSTAATKLLVWLDTAFTGELVIPREVIDRIGLTQSSAVSAGLADGKQVVLETFTCTINWFGEEVAIEVIESNAQYGLLGIGLLHDHKVEIDYRLRTVVIS